MINFFHYRNRITPGRDQMSGGLPIVIGTDVLKIYLEPMINFLGGGTLRKCLVDIFSERASLPRWRLKQKL
jgi:hypothetical protein